MRKEGIILEVVSYASDKPFWPKISILFDIDSMVVVTWLQDHEARKGEWTLESVKDVLQKVYKIDSFEVERDATLRAYEIYGNIPLTNKVHKDIIVHRTDGL